MNDIRVVHSAATAPGRELPHHRLIAYRVARADKARAFVVARGEALEAAAAVEIAALCGEVPASRAAEVARLADRVYALLTPLCRRA